MTTTRRFRADDLFRFNNVNLDVLTETYNNAFYLQYLATWPDYCVVQESPSKRLMGYILGKAEGEGKRWHGHVTAVTIAPEYRRIGCAEKLMHSLEKTTSDIYNGYFVDLYVRISNALAITMYEKFGYNIYRQVIDYYGSETEPEDAYDMRKACPRDRDKTSIIPLDPLRQPPTPFD